MKKQSIWVFQWRKSVHYWWSYILFSPECKELTSMLDPLLYRWGVPPVVIRCVHWTMQMWVLQTWIKALGLYIVMLIKIHTFSFKKMHLKMSSVKWRPFCLSLNVSKQLPDRKNLIQKPPFCILAPSISNRKNMAYKVKMVLWPPYICNGNPCLSQKSFLSVNSFWPCDAIWWHRSRSTLAQVMACCLMAPSHYLNQRCINMHWTFRNWNLNEITIIFIQENSLKMSAKNVVRFKWSMIWETKWLNMTAIICFVIKLLVTTLVRQGIYMTQWGCVTHMCQWICSFLIQVMVCSLSSAKPLLEQMMTYC